MQLISILLVIVGILTFLSGAIVFFGSKKEDRPNSTWYFIASFFSTTWLTSVAFFLTAKADRTPFLPILINTGLISSVLLDAGFLGYGAWRHRLGKFVTLIFLAAALVIAGFIIAHPEWIYTNITLSPTGNFADLIVSPLLICYIAYFALILPCITFTFFHNYRKARSRNKRIGNFVIMIACSLSAVASLIANLILPFFHNWSVSWLGPLTISIVILSIYYMILRYKAINLSYIWLRVFSYIVIVSSIAIVYMIIFSIIFAALFRGSTPSLEVIALNFIMLLIFIALIPAMNSFIRSIRRLILAQHPNHKKPASKETTKKHERP